MRLQKDLRPAVSKLTADIFDELKSLYLYHLPHHNILELNIHCMHEYLNHYQSHNKTWHRKMFQNLGKLVNRLLVDILLLKFGIIQQIG